MGKQGTGKQLERYSSPETQPLVLKRVLNQADTKYFTNQQY